ncbi:hypothetical protein [Falsochrobactrum shanghaiense]|uniref:hypothetical protein n=1 Tax=Falsochrobactrum shanghaiense TaxID=2201899 RepID=UPI001FDF02E3|nr:hypothetical protein [Falsochrobactrum shanghaiense]
MVYVTGLCATHHAQWMMVQEAEAQLRPVFVIASAGARAALLVILALPGGLPF